MTSALHLGGAYRALRAGGVIGYPTEAVWGLGCDPLNAHAVERLLDIKRRSPYKGLILIASSLDQVRPFVGELPHARWLQVQHSWPGPVTWLLPASKRAPALIRGDSDRVAVRVTAHPLASALCYVFGGAIVSTSANRAGQPPARSALQLRRNLGRELDFILPGELGGLARPTSIRDALTGKLVRP